MLLLPLNDVQKGHDIIAWWLHKFEALFENWHCRHCGQSWRQNWLGKYGSLPRKFQTQHQRGLQQSILSTDVIDLPCMLNGWLRRLTTIAAKTIVKRLDYMISQEVPSVRKSAFSGANTWAVIEASVHILKTVKFPHRPCVWPKIMYTLSLVWHKNITNQALHILVLTSLFTGSKQETEMPL